MKRLLLTVLVMCLAAGMWAGSITREQALRQAQQFMNQKGKSLALTNAETPMTKARARGQQMPDYYYVFNAGQNQGFVIVSGDDRTPAILGYADKGAFNMDEMADGLKALLNSYASQIELLQKSQGPAYVQKANHAAVSPLIQTTWNQRSPYNDNCKFDLANGSTLDAVTGCVATMMAQVMYYRRYPAQVLGEIPSYQINYTGIGTTTFSAVSAGTAIDWNNMKLSYDGSESETEKQAVANLMLYCGKSVHMRYNGSGSSASVSEVPSALKNYFGYYKGITYVRRADYTDDQWDNMVYQELAAERPVMMGGQDAATQNANGHAFICDGYDGAGKYHINWGWGGLSDGFYTLADLTPENQGVGGSGRGYNFTQEAVLGVKKDDGTFTETVRLTTDYIELGDRSVFQKSGSQYLISFRAKFSSRLANTYDIDYNFAVYKNGTFMEYLNPDAPLQTFNFVPNSTYFPNNGVMQMYLPYYDGVKLYNAFATPGTYKMIPVSRKSGDSKWNENEGSDRYYLSAVVTSNTLTLYVGEAPEQPVPEISDAERTALKSQVDQLATVINAKSATLKHNADNLKDLAAKIAAAKNELDKIDQQIADIEKKLGDDLLSETDKKSFQTTLNLIKDSRKTYYDTLYELQQSYNTVKTAHDKQASALNSITDVVNNVNRQVNTVETKAAYNNLVAQINDAETALAGIDPSTIETEINAEYVTLAKLPQVSNMTDALKQLVEQVDKAIEDAKKAKEEEDKKKQEEKRDSLKAEITRSVDALVAQLNVTVTKLAETKTYVLQLKDMLPTIDEAILKLEEQAAALKTLLEDNNARTRAEGWTDEQRAIYLAKLDDIVNKQIPDLKTQRDKLVAEISKTEEAIAEQESTVDKLKKQIDDVNDAVSKATTLEAVDAQVSALAKIKTTADQLEVDLPKITQKIAEQQSATVALMATVNNAVKAAQEAVTEVRTAKDEEYKKQQEEKRDSLKAEVTTSADALAAQLEATLVELTGTKTSVMQLKDILSSIDEAIQKLNEQADALKAILEKGSAQTGRTRSEGLTDEQRTAYQAKLDDIVNKQIPELKAQHDELAVEIAKIEAAIAAQESMVDNLKEKIADLKDVVGKATTLEAVDAQVVVLANIKAEADQLGVDLPQIAQAITAQQDVTSALMDAVSNAVKAAQEIVAEADKTWTGIGGIAIDESEIEGRYDLSGNRVDDSYKGIVIMKMKNGQIRKQIIR